MDLRGSSLGRRSRRNRSEHVGEDSSYCHLPEESLCECVIIEGEKKNESKGSTAEKC